MSSKRATEAEVEAEAEAVKGKPTSKNLQHFVDTPNGTAKTDHVNDAPCFSLSSHSPSLLFPFC